MKRRDFIQALPATAGLLPVAVRAAELRAKKRVIRVQQWEPDTCDCVLVQVWCTWFPGLVTTVRIEQCERHQDLTYAACEAAVRWEQAVWNEGRDRTMGWVTTADGTRKLVVRAEQRDD